MGENKKNIRVKLCKYVNTFDSNGTPNGWLLELVSGKDGFTKHLKGQMYLTVAEPGKLKGYHLHALADYYVTCIKGRVQEIIYKDKSTKEVIEMGDNDFKTVELPHGYPHAIKNIGTKPAYVLIYRHPAWDPNVHEQFDIDPDEIETDEAWENIKKFMEQFQND
ncbi:WxcM-like domain-containing protein [Patescibacteria group bacterium AH-259-L07]|nr:WxcM-like domain-containing protein [Patescibacteria group bacterium AH-259-L07]